MTSDAQSPSSPRPASSRAILRITGGDASDFLQGLITNDLARASEGALLYAALLSPQGKYLFDFFIFEDEGAFYLDIKADRAPDFARRLAMYRLRADVAIDLTDMGLTQHFGQAPEGAMTFSDPRHAKLGERSYGTADAAPPEQWDALRVTHIIPETGIELLPDETFILEAGFERLAGVDFRKGCYVGQEVTARMKHKTELRKGLVGVTVEGAAPVGTEIKSADGRVAGKLFSQANGMGIAYLRLDRAEGPLVAGTARVALA